MRCVTVLLLLCTFGATALANSGVLLSDVNILTFHAFDVRNVAMAMSRRNVPRPSLTCETSGASRAETCHAFYLPNVVQCINMGLNDRAQIDWRCEAQLKPEVVFGSSTVVCEGYENDEDVRVLAGSCSLVYTLRWSAGYPDVIKLATLNHPVLMFFAIIFIFLALAWCGCIGRGGSSFTSGLIVGSIVGSRDNSSGSRTSSAYAGTRLV